MTGPEQEEYRALRATIRERGTLRVCIFVTGIAAWAALTIATAALASTPIATILPLLVLASIFEAVFALHIGVERVGRYIQVFYEGDASRLPQWEHAAMAFGQPKGAPASDALFTLPFFLASVCNAAPAAITQPTASEMMVVGGAHALFVLRLLVARNAARRQRAIDFDRFRQLNAEAAQRDSNRATS